MFIFERGTEPRRVKKYELAQDEIYRSLMECIERMRAGAEPRKEAV